MAPATAQLHLGRTFHQATRSSEGGGPTGEQVARMVTTEGVRMDAVP